MPRTSYLQQIARRANSNLPLLKPPRSVTRSGGTTSSLSQDALAETRLSVQRPSALTIEPNSVPFLQGADVKEHKHILSDTQEITPLPPNTPLKRHDPAVPEAPALSSPGGSDEVERGAPPIVSRRPHMGAQVTPAKPPSHITADIHEPLPAPQIVSTRQVDKPSEMQVLHTRPRSISEQGQTAAARSTRSLPIDDPALQSGDTSVSPPPKPAQITLVPLPAARPAASMRESRMPQGTAIHIGCIDVQIMPSPIVPPAPATVRSTAKPQSGPALSREFTSSFGLRQG
jgi:hypothetical protein